MSAVPFDLVHDMIVVVPVRYQGFEWRFLLDTGAGIEAISPNLNMSRRAHGSFTGTRMSGEQLTVDLIEGTELQLGEYRSTPRWIGVHDIFDRLPPELGPIHGALSLRFFETQPFTIDYAAGEIRFEASQGGESVPLRLEIEDDVTLSAFAPATLDGGVERSFLVDSGASHSVVDESLMASLEPDDPQVAEGTGETGHPYRRTIARVRELAVGSAHQAEPTICFEAIRYDGVIGGDFLRHFIVRFDLPARRMTLI